MRAQRAPDAGDRPAGADARDERVGLRVAELLQDLRARRRQVDAGLVGFLNCSGMNEFGFAAAIAFASSTAPRMTRSAGVRCSSAPYARSSAIRSGDMFSGMVRISR